MLFKYVLGASLAAAPLLMTTACMAQSHADFPPRPGRDGQKYRIMVDKVYMADRPEARLLEEDYQRIASLGFNVVSPRLHGNDREEIRVGAELAKKHGMYFMAWQRGSFPASIVQREADMAHGPLIDVLPHEREAGYEPIRYTLDTGHEFDLLSPNSDEFWELLTANLLKAAELAEELPILGAFVDLELYARPRPAVWSGHLYALSFDTKILADFAKAHALPIPDLEPAERKPYLEERGLLEQFRDFQLEQWRTRARELRRKIDAVAPDFQLGIYPPSYTLFIEQIAAFDLGNERAPIIACEYYTYAKGFPNKDRNPEYWKISDDEGVELNVNFIRRRANAYTARKEPFHIIGGIDPILEHGKDPRFQAMSITAMSHEGDGYWVFYEGIEKYSPEFDAFERWFTRANRAILDGVRRLNPATE